MLPLPRALASGLPNVAAELKPATAFSLAPKNDQFRCFVLNPKLATMCTSTAVRRSGQQFGGAPRACVRRSDGSQPRQGRCFDELRLLRRSRPR